MFNNLDVVADDNGTVEIKMTPSMLSCIEFLWPASTTVWEEIPPPSSHASLDNGSISKVGDAIHYR